MNAQAQSGRASGGAVTLGRIEQALSLTCLAPPRADHEVDIGFASDVPSEVLARAPRGSVLVTAQSGLNVIAVAAYVRLAGIVVTSGYRPEDEVVARAREEGMALYVTSAPTFEVVGRLSRLGIRGRQKTDGAAGEPGGEKCEF